MSLFYQRRRLKVNKIRRQINANKAILLRIKVLIAIIMCFSICFLSYKILKLPQWYISSAKILNADSSVIKLHGNVITPDYKIINIIRQTQIPYVQMFRLNPKDLVENILQLQTIKKVYVRRYWFPARLVIFVEERTPAFVLVPNLDSPPVAALTTDGIILDRDYFPFKTQIKNKKILTYGVRNGQEEVWDKQRVDEVLNLVKMIEGYSNQEVQYLDLRNPNDAYVMLEEYLIRLGEINDTLPSRVKWIATILPEAKKINQKIKYIDLRWEDSRYFRLDGSKEIESSTSITEQQVKKENKSKTVKEQETDENQGSSDKKQAEQEPKQVQEASFDDENLD